jgi:hypothetical protein
MNALRFPLLRRSVAFDLIVATAMMVLVPQADAAGPYENRGTPEQERGCRPDVVRNCRGINDTFAIEQCLRANGRGGSGPRAGRSLTADSE